MAIASQLAFTCMGSILITVFYEHRLTKRLTELSEPFVEQVPNSSPLHDVHIASVRQMESEQSKGPRSSAELEGHQQSGHNFSGRHIKLYKILLHPIKPYKIL